MDEEVKILVVEDDVDINNLLSEILYKKGYFAHQAYSGTEGLMCLEKSDFKLVLLDLMLPGMTGEKLIEKVRRVKNMPIIVISAKSEQSAKIEALKLGADDFVSKPFDIDEVVARVEAQLRRYLVFSSSNRREDIITYKKLSLNRETREVLVNNSEISLTSREFSILELLIANPKKVFTKANLFSHVWNDSYLGDDNTINVHISNLRSKISQFDPENEYIHTVWGIGFKMQE